MKSFIQNISIREFQKYASYKFPRNRRVIAASLYCLVAFFARYSVHYGHDCEQINPWQRNDVSSELKGVPKKGHCHQMQEETGDEEKHSHSDCQVCHSYEELVNSTFEEFAPSILIHLSGVDTITESEVQIVMSARSTPYRPRGPPSHQLT